MLVTEFCPGGKDLFEWIQDWFEKPTTSPLSSPEVARYFFVQVMQAVEHIHNEGVFSYDIKDSNIMVDHHCD